MEHTGNDDDWCNGVVFQVAEKELPGVRAAYRAGDLTSLARPQLTRMLPAVCALTRSL